MADYLIQDTTLTGISDAIRGKTGGTGPIPVSGMAGAISGIQTGGGGGLLIIDVDMSSMTTSLSTDEVLLAMSEGKYPVLKVPVTKNDVMYLPFVCKSINGYSFCGYVYANGEWQLFGVVVSGNKLIKTVANQFTGVNIMHSSNALRIKSTDGQKTFAIVVDGDGTIRAEEVN